MEFLYKFTPHNTDYKYDIIEKSQLWFSKVENFNDPFDSQLDYCQNYTREEIRNFWENFPKDKLVHSLNETLEIYGNNKSFTAQQRRVFRLQKSQMGVLCLSLKPDNILMWSHYANNHKGIVYEFKPNLFSDNLDTHFKGVPYKIDYPDDKSYDLLSYTIIGDDKKQQFLKELTTKSIDWKYEEEYRFIDLANNGNKSFNPLSLNSIIFGVKTDESEIEKILELCSQNGLHHIRFKRAEMIKGKFELNIVDI